MGQKTNPIGNRLGIIRGWDSSWFGGNDFAEKVVEDQKIRQFIISRIEKGAVARVVIERTRKRVTVTIHTSRPGIIIGKGGQEVDLLREKLKKMTDKDVQINIHDVQKPELNATIVGETIAKQIEARINYRKAIKTAVQSTMRMGEGIKVRISGRLNGADMAREEEFKEGRSPLHTFRADIDYAVAEAQTVYGKLGIKVWICRGEILKKVDLSDLTGGSNYKDNNQGNREQRNDGNRDRRDGGNREKREGGSREKREGGNNNRNNNNNRGGADKKPRKF
jgi:small subunit ribosomal protein S3